MKANSALINRKRLLIRKKTDVIVIYSNNKPFYQSKTF
jgi:hypothetical protein